MVENIKVSAIQMDCVLEDKDANLKKAQSLIKDAAKEGSKLIVLPELFNTGYRVEEKDHLLAEPLEDGKTITWMKQCAKETKTYLVTSFLESGLINGVVYDTAVIVGPNGLIGSYRKAHLWDQENVRFTKGEDFPVFKTEIGTIGLQICYEVGFPESARTLSLKGSDIIIYTAAFGKARLYAWDLATRARALENGVFVIASNRIGEDKDSIFGGHSRIVNPKGEILSENKSDEGVVTANINLQDVPEQRRTIPYLRDINKRLFAKHYERL